MCDLVKGLGSVKAVQALASLEDLDSRADHPALLIVDIEADDEAWATSPRLAGTEAAKVLLARRRDPALARRAFAAGYRAMIPKTLEPPLVAAALSLVLAGGLYFPCLQPSANESEPVAGAAYALSPRRQEVLDRMVLGCTNKEIAKELGISVATVKLHVQAVLNTIGARNRTEAVTRVRTGQTMAR